MSEKSVEHCYVIEFSPPAKFNEKYYFSVQEHLFVDIEKATRFRDVAVAKAFANEFGIKFDPHTAIRHIKDL